MSRPVYEHICLIDASAAIALRDSREEHHASAVDFFQQSTNLRWAAVNLTAHEVYTRSRYAHNVQFALNGFEFLRGADITVFDFLPEDEVTAKTRLVKWSDHKISFIDAICASVMLREGIYKIFTYDRDFHILGFEMLPGVYR